MLLTAVHCSLLFSCFVVLFPLALGKKDRRGSLGSMAGSPSLPLIQVLLEQIPAEPQVLWRKQTNAQHFQYMVNLYQQLAEEDGRPRRERKVGSNTVRLVRPSRSSMRFVRGPWYSQAISFHLQGLLKVEYLVRATVVCSRTWSVGNSQFFCKMEQLPAGHVTSKPSFTNQSIYPSHKRSSSEKWVELDITSHVQSLMEDSNNLWKHLNLRHVCSISEKTGSSFSRQEWKKVASLNIPFLLLYLNDTQKNSSKTNVEHTYLEEPGLEKDTAAEPILSRKTRQVGSISLDFPSYRQKNTVAKNQCSLRSFRVSFHQLGWDHWIIAPHKYNPKYCKGDCPRRILPYGYNSPNHAIVQNYINELVDQNVPRPSCVPYKYSPISVLMIEPNGSILYKEYENMIAESCTCR
ncbi:bone morphogenetic protein 15 [Microcaecilia unicolor]|uniref:Bone morphogenetic protein 15 n=1 Tax=Microcaecilia unicolor TaxID=1415580 RepID=A0A6P7YTA7_9AMPH|nr:bone morphogenetic protein 15 [Microcaecilia unicolor]